MRSKRILLVLALIISIPMLHAEEEKKVEKAETVEKDKPVPEAKVTVTKHQLKIAGKTIKYTASAGTMLMKNSEDEPIALFGYTAYVRDKGNQSQRPIIFAYNGGPGSASLWLHMGVLGPQRALIKDVEFGSNGPFVRVDNEYSILDQADLVMIDPVGTGFSRPVGKGKGEDFWGVDQDIKSVSDFIRQYVTVSGRWSSPKYILGESYGGMRSGGVAYYLLSKHNLALNGVILVSPFMELVTGSAGLGVDIAHILYLPTYSATAWYHNQLENRPDQLEDLMTEVEAFTINEYAPALLKGSRLTVDERQNITEKLARYTGLSASYWDAANLRIDEGRFTKELLRDEKKTAGRIDSRFKGDSLNHLSEVARYDPMIRAIGPAFLATFMDYYRGDLKVSTDLEYRVFADVFKSWDWKHQQPDIPQIKMPFPNTSIDLSYTMVQNPNMKVLVQQGYFDLATPHFIIDYVVDHMDISPELRKNIIMRYYEAGHMMYIHGPSLKKFKKDLAEFIQQSH